MKKRDYIAMITSFIAVCFCGVIAITDSYIWHRIAFLFCTVGASMSFGMSFIDFVYYIATRGYKKEKGLGEEKSNQEEPLTVANPDTPTETDFKYFTAEQVINMSLEEVKENYSDIMKSMNVRKLTEELNQKEIEWKIKTNFWGESL